ncbi:sensor domain-containing diguanylate cyclase [Ammoniphilus resinae]|uniref:Diguanylate cyclase (GGDEF)-like protein/PAS domain S-box-containing protein n=1 Tax=Ammoniphilus resinae TaxID=861532 RepID=A0ABS4GLD5_9BACL|nr:GGDEF domain-containing protein [Ammoniphilus resinae]MBP1931052.1 diguanylate cyclase (GGDEF)-like protein/PAS domain S-box-containing protein [Ammoniphilus resinae]
MKSTIFQSAPVPMLLYKEKILYANPAFIELTGYPENEIYKIDLWDFIEEESREIIQEAIKNRALNQMPKAEYQFKLYTKSKDTRWIHLVATTILLNNEYIGFATCFDITEQKHLQDQLKLKDLLWTNIFNQHSAIMLLVDPEAEGTIVDANPAASQFYGYSIDQLKQMKISEINVLPISQITHSLQEAKENQKKEFRFKHRLANGEIRDVQVYSSTILGMDKKLLFSIIHDITDQVIYENELVHLNKKLKKISSLDGLTGIYNRRAFDQFILHSWQGCKQLSLIMVDIDQFKKYNDTYGHLQGDECLKQVAEALVSSVQRSADLVARYGGEEFAVILQNSSKAGVLHVAEKLRDQVESLRIPHSASDVSEFVTISLGVCHAESADSIEDLIVKADQALYLAKNRGRNQVVMYEETG